MFVPAQRMNLWHLWGEEMEKSQQCLLQVIRCLNQ